MKLNVTRVPTTTASTGVPPLKMSKRMGRGGTLVDAFTSSEAVLGGGVGVGVVVVVVDVVVVDVVVVAASVCVMRMPVEIVCTLGVVVVLLATRLNAWGRYG